MALRQPVERIDEYSADLPDDDVVPTAHVLAFRTREAAFSALERQVIEVARTDRLASLEAPGMIERVVAFLFGLVPGSRPLADPRLEALRRAVVVTRHRHHLPDAIAAELGRIGYSVAQIRLIETLAMEN